MLSFRICGLILVLLCVINETTACGRGRRRRRCPPRDSTPPSLTCPSHITTIADPIQVNAKVSWTEPKAYDNGKEVAVSRRGLGPGKLFSEGKHYIRYSAKDQAGNSRSCTFTITVRVVRCSWFQTPSDGYRLCHPSTDMRYGGVCRFGCYPGHELDVPSRTKCGNDGRWSQPTQPTCKKKTCPQLFPTAGQNGIVTINCTDSNNYRSKCTYSCVEGYSVGAGHSKVRVCGVNGGWVGAMPECLDTKAPEFTNCPAVKTTYAERSRTSGRAFWDDPLVTDNSGSVTSEQIEGPTSGTELQTGEYEIQYRAVDNAGNRATCKFKLVVKLVTCPAIYPLPYTSVTCPTGRLWGSTCQFTCDNGTASSFPLETLCKRHGAKYHYGLWDFGKQQPYCEQENVCPELRAPDNGALACDIWLAGRHCQMQCQNGYTVYESPGNDVHGGLLVCGNTGTWKISGEIPDCVEENPRFEATVNVSVTFGYYDGPCEDAIDEIKENFLNRYKESIGSCHPPQCVTDNVKVICGVTDSQARKRDTSSNDLVVEVDHVFSGDLSYAEKVQLRENMKRDLAEASASGGLDIVVRNQTLVAENIDIGAAEPTCQPGMVPKGKSSCVKCGPGTFDDRSVTPNACTKCAIGYYQEETGQITCKKCPTGMTTETIGAQECKEACLVGHYSQKGTPPCSPCDIGTYADLQGTRQCTDCPGSMTTNITGSSSSSQCFEYDIEFTGPDGDEDFVAPSVIVDTSSVQQWALSMWFTCTSCENIFNITYQNGSVFLSLSGPNGEERLLVGRTLLPATQLSFHTSKRWHKLYIAWTPDSVQMYADAVLIQNTTLSASTLPQTLNVTIGGPGFIGRMSQVNMFSTVETTQRKRRSTKDPGNTCFGGDVGDALAWRDFAMLDGSFVQTRSKCDAVDNCLSSPCKNGGTCSDAIGGFICECVEGFVGTDCSENIDDCEYSVCDNSGTCVDGVNGYSCSCPSGFSGELCEIKVVDGVWASFGNWSLCSVTCGNGTQVRYRTCDNPEPSNGGADCEGSNQETKLCTMEECNEECKQDPEPIVHGSLNCYTEADNETRRCTPRCDDGYAFDTDLFTDPPNVVCGPETGDTWNFKSDINPEGLLPTCQAKAKGKTNTAIVEMAYDDLSIINDPIRRDVQSIVDEKVSQTACVSSKRCEYKKIDLALASNSDSRRRRSTSTVTVTLELSCTISSSIDECYDLLASVVYELNDLIAAYAFTVTYDGSGYDIIINSTTIDGTTSCDAGYVPVFHYCVACGPGMYQSGEFCERCSVGYYQDESGQSNCKQCPKGWTTLGQQSRDVSYCNVEDKTSDDLSSDYVLIIGLVVGTVILLFIVVGIAIAVYMKTKSKPKRKVGVQRHGQRADFNSNKRFTTAPTFNTMYSDRTPSPSSKLGAIDYIDLEDDFSLYETNDKISTPSKSYSNHGYM